MKGLMAMIRIFFRVIMYPSGFCSGNYAKARLPRPAPVEDAPVSDLRDDGVNNDILETNRGAHLRNAIR